MWHLKLRNQSWRGALTFTVDSSEQARAPDCSVKYVIGLSRPPSLPSDPDT